MVELSPRMHRCCRQNCRCLLFPFRYQRAFWHRFFQRQSDEFPAANGFFSKVKKSNLLAPQQRRFDEMRAKSLLFIGKTATEPLLSCLRWLFEPPKLPQKAEISQPRNCANTRFLPANSSSNSLSAWPSTAFGNFLFLIGKAGILADFAVFKANLRKLFLTFFIFFVI